MGELEEGLGRDDIDVDLLGKLPAKRREAVLAGVALPARELPRARHMLVPRALRDQNTAAIVANDADQNVNRFGADRPRAGRDQLRRPWQCLYFLPDPQGHG